jgi:hypothetical protein
VVTCLTDYVSTPPFAMATDKTNSNMLFANFNQDFTFVVVLLVYVLVADVANNVLDVYQLERAKVTASLIVTHSGASIPNVGFFC